jgi:hypothetical protein
MWTNLLAYLKHVATPCEKCVDLGIHKKIEELIKQRMKQGDLVAVSLGALSYSSG